MKIVDVTLRINPLWGMFIAFEPWTYEESVAAAQQANLFAYIKIGDVMAENQTLGWLQPVVGSEFPHIHWTMYKIAILGNENVNPYTYCAPWPKQSAMDIVAHSGIIPTVNYLKQQHNLFIPMLP